MHPAPQAPINPPKNTVDGPNAGVAGALSLPGLSTAQVSGSVAIPNPIPADLLDSLTAVILAALAKQTEELVHIRYLLQREAKQPDVGDAIAISPGPESAAAGTTVGPAAILRKHGRRYFLLWLNAAHSLALNGPLGSLNYALQQGWNNLSFLDDGTLLKSGDGASFTGYALACDDVPPGLL